MYRLFFMLFMISFLTQAQNDTHKNPVVVLELFTSQGCSSCPPADELLNEVSQKFSNKTIVLSYHVDYWNYIGWKDPFSKKRFSDNQRKYGRKFNSSSIYTPQVVINGKEHFVGSNKALMYTKLSSYFEDESDYSISINELQRNTNTITFDYDVSGHADNHILRLALVIKKRITEVKRGENSNRTLENTNIVVEESYLTLNQSKGKASLRIPDLVRQSDELSLILLIQNKKLDIKGGKQVAL